MSGRDSISQNDFISQVLDDANSNKTINKKALVQKVRQAIIDFSLSHAQRKKKSSRLAHCILYYLPEEFKEKYELERFHHAYQEDKTPSFEVAYIQDKETKKETFFFKCFGCGFRAYMNPINEKDKKLPSIPEILEAIGEEDLAFEVKRAFGFKQTQDYQKHLSQEEVKELVNISNAILNQLIEEDNIPPFLIYRFPFLKTKEQIKAFVNKYKLGVYFGAGKFQRFENRFIIPYLSQDGEPIALTARALNDDETKYLFSNKHKLLFHQKDIDFAKEQGYVFLIEGEIDAITAIEATEGAHPVLGFAGNGFSEKMQRIILDLINSKVNFFIIHDPDEAGANEADSLLKFIDKHGGVAVVSNLKEFDPQFHGDLNDLLVTRGKKEVSDFLNFVLGNSATDDVYYLQNILPVVYSTAHQKKFTSGLKELDAILGGGFSSGFHVIGGAPAIGKTSFALNLALENAKANNKVLYFTYEMPKRELWFRLIAMLFEKPELYYQLKRKRISSEEAEKIFKNPKLAKIAEFVKIVEGFEVSEGGSVQHIRNLVKKAILEDKEMDTPIVVIDYIQRMPVPKELRIKNIRERIEFNVGELQASVAREFNIPVVALSSVSRPSYDNNKNNKADLSSFKESGLIEYSAYNALTLKSEEELDNFKKKIRIKVVKNRENSILMDLIYIHDTKLNTWEFDEKNNDTYMKLLQTGVILND